MVAVEQDRLERIDVEGQHLHSAGALVDLEQIARVGALDDDLVGVADGADGQPPPVIRKVPVTAVKLNTVLRPAVWNVPAFGPVGV